MKIDLKEFREQCIDYPIMADESLDVIINHLKQGDKVLEIGTCVGYSATYLSIHQEIQLTTIERDPQRASLARTNLNRLNDITFIEGDALELNINEYFDVIIFDAAKAQNLKFFDKYKMNLKPDGIIFVDNVHFHGYVKNPELIVYRKNLYRMILKMKDFVEQMINSQYNVEILDVGDGLMIIKNVSQ